MIDDALGALDFYIAHRAERLAQVEAAVASLRDQLDAANRHAGLDSLTGLRNVRAFYERLEHDVAPARRRYYEAQMLAMIAINRDSVRILYRVGRAIEAYRRGHSALALAHVRRTLPLFAQLRHLEHGAEYGRWKHWYRGEWLVGIRHTRALVGDFIHYLHDPTLRLPPPFLDNGWHGDYPLPPSQGPRTADGR